MKTLPTETKELIEKEFQSRTITQFENSNTKPINTFIKITLVILPFMWQIIILIQLLFTREWMVSSRQWKKFWLFLSFGFLLWFILTMFFSRYYLSSILENTNK